MRKYILSILFLFTLSAGGAFAAEDDGSHDGFPPIKFDPDQMPERDPDIKDDKLESIPTPDIPDIDIPDNEIPDKEMPPVDERPDFPDIEWPETGGPDVDWSQESDEEGYDREEDYDGTEPPDYDDNYQDNGNEPPAGGSGGGSPPYDPNYLENKAKLESVLPSIITIINTNETVNTKYSDLKITNEVKFEYNHSIPYGRALKDTKTIEVGSRIIDMSLYDQVSNIIHELAHLYRDPCKTELIIVDYNPPLICEPVNESHRKYLQNEAKKEFTELSSVSNIVQSEKELYEASVTRHFTKSETYIRNEINALQIELELMGGFISQEYREKQQFDLWTWQMILNAIEKQKK